MPRKRSRGNAAPGCVRCGAVGLVEAEAFARIVPHRGHRWVAIEEVAALLAELGANPEWEQELRAE